VVVSKHLRLCFSRVPYAIFICFYSYIFDSFSKWCLLVLSSIVVAVETKRFDNQVCSIEGRTDKVICTRYLFGFITGEYKILHSFLNQTDEKNLKLLDCYCSLKIRMHWPFGVLDYDFRVIPRKRFRQKHCNWQLCFSYQLHLLCWSVMFWIWSLLCKQRILLFVGRLFHLVLPMWKCTEGVVSDAQ
jgi:hypothetical protein